MSKTPIVSLNELPTGWRIVRAPDVTAGAPPRGSMWAVSEDGPATSLCWSEQEVIEKAWALRARLARMLDAMRQDKAA